LPVALAGVYAAALGTSATGHRRPHLVVRGLGVGRSGRPLYSHPASGQYIILGDTAGTSVQLRPADRGLPAHRLLWYSIPVVVWVITIALSRVSAARAFGRYGAGLAIAGLLCLAPVGLMLVFQPTAHTNVVFHAAVLAWAGWVAAADPDACRWQGCSVREC